MLEHIGEDIDENFNLKPDKINDNNYNKALSCLRKHLDVIKYVLYLILTIHFICSIVCHCDQISPQIRGTDRVHVYKYISGQH